jgi:hypothetical protein
MLDLFDHLRPARHDPRLDEADRVRRIRDRFREYDGRFDNDC